MTQPFEEIEAVADEAKRWNTYLAVHTDNDAGTQRALEAGAMSIEHAHLITESTIKMIAKKWGVSEYANRRLSGTRALGLD